MTLQKIIKIAVIIIGLIAVFFLVRIMMIGDEAIETNPDNHGILSSFATLAYVVLGIAAISAVVFSLINLLTNPDKLKRALLSVGVFIAIVALAFFLSSGEQRTLDDGSVLTASQSQWIEAGIKAFYILILVAGGLMLFFGVKKTLTR